MKNPIQPTTQLTIPDPMKGGEATFELRFDYESIARAEELTGRALLMGLTPRDCIHPTINLVRVMLYAALLPTQPDITFAEASAFVTRKTIRLVWEKVSIAWVAAAEEPEGAKTDPTQGQS